MSRKQKKVYTTLNYIEYYLILAATITGYISIPAFACFVGIPIGITSCNRIKNLCNSCRN